MAAVYTYLATDLLTNAPIGELPLYSVTFDRQINKAGNFQASTNLDDEIIDNATLLSGTAPGRTAMFVYRDGQIVWGGIIWSRTYQSAGKVIQITGQTFESYAYRRVWRPASTIKYNTGQSFILADVWTQLQNSDTNCNIGVTVPGSESLPGSDIVRTMTVNPWDMKYYGNYIDDPLMSFTDSPDYTIECYDNAGIPSKILNIGYPRLGSIIDYSGLVADYPGNTMEYTWAESAANGATRAYATGDGDGSDMKIGVSTNSSLLAAGWPLIETVNSHAGVTVQATINAHAVSDLAAMPMPKSSPTIMVKADQAPTFGTYYIGDDCRIIIEEGSDPRFPNGLDAVVRVVGWHVQPSESSQVETVQLVIAGSENVGAV